MVQIRRYTYTVTRQSATTSGFVLNFLTHHHPHNPRRRPSSDSSFTHHHLGPLAHLPPTPPSPLRPPTPSPPPASSTSPPPWSICGSGSAATRVLPVHLHHQRPQRRRLHIRFVDPAVQPLASSYPRSTTHVFLLPPRPHLFHLRPPRVVTAFTAAAAGLFGLWGWSSDSAIDEFGGKIGAWIVEVNK
uniref:Uncharacterized protein n=1 Tax=Kalanchoe fedtschenkoi TaxID=63787 RepID=A0A7N0U136_KALFE